MGIASREPDRVAQESQGSIADRTREVPGTSDRGVVMFREMLEDALEAVDCGDDPAGICREDNGGLILFDAQRVRDGQLIQA